jgi:hypothetical protein
VQAVRVAEWLVLTLWPGCEFKASSGSTMPADAVDWLFPIAHQGRECKHDRMDRTTEKCREATRASRPWMGMFVVPPEWRTSDADG